MNSAGKIAKILQLFALFLFFGSLNACSNPVTAPEARNPTTTPAVNSTPLPTATSAPVVCVASNGKVITDSVPSKILHDPISLKIYLPQCYDPTGASRYPVLYMLHGQTYLNDQWLRIGIDTAADKLIADKQIQPFIIVMPQEDASTSDPYTAKFGDAVVQEVIPYVDDHLATCTDRSCRAIGGLSRGGNWAVRIGLSNPTLFAAIGAHSTPLFYGDLDKIPAWVKAADSLENVPVLYLDMGKSDENRENILQFEEMLSSLGVVHDYYQFIGFHEEKYWAAHVEDYLRWYSLHLSGAIKQAN